MLRNCHKRDPVSMIESVMSIASQPSEAVKAGELPKSYVPASHEGPIQQRWEQVRAFHANPRDPGRPYSIVIPPPNVTAALHLGHAFNNTLQDVLIRHHRMLGRNTLWMPGTDHAGIATQTVVEKRLLAEQGKRRTDFGRDEFVARVQEWKDEYEATITEQLQSMGCSCDWDRQRFTMDEMCATAVREAFFQLFKAGLIYRGKRLVNWDPVTLTALADDEVEMKEVHGSFWYLRYPLVHASENPDDPKDCQEVTWSELAARGYPGADNLPDEQNAWVTVATTRPETYLGDTAVAVNPKDPRAAAVQGLYVQVPLVGRVIPIIEDDYVVLSDPQSSDPKAKFATGFLKVTPAHDPNDWEIGRRHQLPVINVMAPDASICDQHGWEDVGDAQLFVGMSREDAREKVVAEFKARGLLEAVKPYSHSVGHSYRSHVPIEPYLSDQWYVKVSDDRLVGEAQRALSDEQFEGQKPFPPGKGLGAGERQGDGELKFFPSRYAKMYQSWHENLRDWCISRQLWWGHRIPVWHRRLMLSEADSAQVFDEAGFYIEGVDHLMQGEPTASTSLAVVGPDGIVHENQLPKLPATPGEFDFFICTKDTEFANKLEAIGFTQDRDVLDTWFSSGLWPLSTMGWPDPSAYPDTEGLLDTFNPTSVLCTGRDIITLWVSRMVMFNRFFNEGKVPYRHVYINPMIQDGHGQRMSKSLGNGVDPRDIIHSHGADALRFSLVQMATTTQDCRMPVDMVCPHCEHSFEPKQITSPAGYTVAAPEQTCPSCSKTMISGYGAASGSAKATDDAPLARNTSKKFDLGRNFANKLWNAARFTLSRIDADAATSTDEMMLVDRWIIARLGQTIGEVERAIGSYQFAAYAEAMYDFIWRDFCDWYLEAIKPTVAENAAQRRVAASVFNAILRLLHPICPFVTEALWPAVREGSQGTGVIEGLDLRDNEMLATAAWPVINAKLIDEQAIADFERVQSLTTTIRTQRSERKVKPRRRIALHVSQHGRFAFDLAPEAITALAELDTILSIDNQRPDDAVGFTFEGEEQWLSGLVDAVDKVEERAMLESEIAALRKSIATLDGRLQNPGYVEKAPEHLVNQTRAERAAKQEDLDAKLRQLEQLDG